jgi:hypothetical protein
VGLNLPPALTSFVGRESEIAEIEGATPGVPSAMI